MTVEPGQRVFVLRTRSAIGRPCRFTARAVAALFFFCAGCVNERDALRLYGAETTQSDADAANLSDTPAENLDAPTGSDVLDVVAPKDTADAVVDIAEIAADLFEVSVDTPAVTPDVTEVSVDSPDTPAGPDIGPLNPECPNAGAEAACGDGKCSPGENPKCCPEDCCGDCGDGKCKNYACEEGDVKSKNYCAKDCIEACGDGKCNPGENPLDCPKDCSEKACGDGVCAVGETPTNCATDCGTSCGDCKCDVSESYDTCPVDCGSCGDGVCSNCKPKNAEVENATTCPKDCK